MGGTGQLHLQVRLGIGDDIRLESRNESRPLTLTHKVPFQFYTSALDLVHYFSRTYIPTSLKKPPEYLLCT